MMAAFAELERNLIRERTMADLAAVRAQGRVGDRPAFMDTDNHSIAQAGRANREYPHRIAKALGVPLASICSHLPTSNT